MMINVNRIAVDLDPRDLDNPVWERADEIRIDRYWSGEAAPESQRFSAWLLWSDSALYIRFKTGADEPPVIADQPILDKKTLGLWDRDVCEIFLAPDPADPISYFEFEVAPTGEWIDLGVRQFEDRRETDWDYASGMTVGARIGQDAIVTAMRIPWSAFGKVPEDGEIWRGNVLRCVGREPDRGYLAWSPTLTPQPNFHVPARFGEFRFSPAR